MVLGGDDPVSRALLLGSIGVLVGLIAGGIAADPKKVFGSSNDRELKRLRPLVAQVNEFEAALQRPQRRGAARQDRRVPRPSARGQRERERSRAGAPARRRCASRRRAASKSCARRSRSRRTRSTRPSRTSSSDLLPEAFACVREASRRTIGLRHYDVQMLGGIVLHRGTHRRDEDRRGQDAGRDAADLPQRAQRPRRPPGHRQRLPGAPRRAVDGPDLPPARALASRRSCTTRASSSTPATWSRTTACSTCVRSSARTPTRPTSPTAPTTSSASTTCATT